MKKFVIAIILVVMVVSLAFSQAKPGGIARQASMGGSQAGYGLVLNPFIMDDPALIFVNPAYQANYKDYLWMNISGGRLYGSSSSDNGYGQQNAGVAFGVTDKLTVGTILSHDPSGVALLPSMMSEISWRSIKYPPSIDNVWEVIGTYEVGSLDLGLGFTYGWSNRDTTYDQSLKYTLYSPIRRDTTVASSRNSEASSTMFGFRAGAIYDLGNGSSVDFSGAIRFDDVVDKMTHSPLDTNSFYPYNRYGGEYSASATEIQFSARAKMKVSNKFNFVPYGTIMMISAEPKEDKRVPLRSYESQWLAKFPETYTYTLDGLAYALGVGGEYHTQSFYFAGGVSLQSGSMEEESKYKFSYDGWTGSMYDTMTYDQSYKSEFKYTTIPVINLGAEWSATDWLTCRIGYQRAIGSLNLTSESKETRSALHDSTYYRVSSANLEYNLSMANSFIFVGGLNPSTFDGLVTLGVGFKFGGFALDATVSEEALRRGLGLFGSNDNLNTFGFMTASYNFTE
ncbi:MAG: hypothetical protein C0417_01415 [Chlorobiaceae bacterium]|nr:hypothetical protein [Chlorobiaceae bacterium]